ncbi:MAG: hypothetical protein JJE25_13590 [Bacteroidia bacterium]|nr:hypothetical protein [Bacteroidia bacterium]
MTKKIIRNILFALGIAQVIFLSSCSTDIDLLEEYKPITIVYGLLNTNENDQYIKINKAFLGEGNALLMAQQRDSVNYQPNDLSVMLQKVNPLTGEVLQTITCNETTGIDKDDGIFSNPYQLLYYTNSSLDSTSNYKLVINRSVDGAQITATTPLVSGVNVTNPSNSNSPINLYNGTSNVYLPYNINWQSGKNAKLYNVVVRFTYYETLISPPGTTDTFTLNYNLGNIVMEDLNSTNAQSLRLEGERYFQFIGSSILQNTSVNRVADSTLQITLTAGAEDLFTYIQVNEPSIGLIQERPTFSNVNNGVGIFSSRWKKTLKNKMSNASINELLNGPYTGQLFP